MIIYLNLKAYENALHTSVVEVSILPWGQIRISNKNEKEPFLWQYEVDITVCDEVKSRII
ncbi:hypothetical protein [Saccharicrinis aurantiacus]|uniref:hypothetical protein n=1 Tax=Saccharicrinis aurantiacus TaxID=1849719 RepID=UPI00094FA3EF|nr:hypothetical protein [Saccharicrinis aurantiacus]